MHFFEAEKLMQAKYGNDIRLIKDAAKCDEYVQRYGPCLDSIHATSKHCPDGQMYFVWKYVEPVAEMQTVTVSDKVAAKAEPAGDKTPVKSDNLNLEIGSDAYPGDRISALVEKIQADTVKPRTMTEIHLLTHGAALDRL